MPLGICRFDAEHILTHTDTISRGARLSIPVSRRALQSLNLLHTLQEDLGAWLRIAQSQRLLPPCRKDSIRLSLYRMVLWALRGFPQFDALRRTRSSQDIYQNQSCILTFGLFIKPSSRSLLMGEQSNTLWILLHNDRKSRHRLKGTEDPYCHFLQYVKPSCIEIHKHSRLASLWITPIQLPWRKGIDCTLSPETFQDPHLTSRWDAKAVLGPWSPADHLLH